MRKDHPAYLTLVRSWRTTPFTAPPYIHKDDDVLETAEAKRSFCIYRGFNDYVLSSDFGNNDDQKLHLGLLPAPYAGDLANATVFILTLNPGLSPMDYYSQSYHKPSCRDSLATIRQEGLDKRYPLSHLSPFRSWAGGYWRQKLDEVVHRAMKSRRLNYQEALSYVSHRVAILELYPYHSKSFHLETSIRRNLKSRALVVDFVHQVLVPEAKAGNSLLVVTRKAASWKLNMHRNIIIYNGAESRAAHLSLKSRGGKRIAEHLGLY